MISLAVSEPVASATLTVQVLVLVAVAGGGSGQVAVGSNDQPSRAKPAREGQRVTIRVRGRSHQRSDIGRIGQCLRPEDRVAGECGRLAGGGRPVPGDGEGDERRDAGAGGIDEEVAAGDAQGVEARLEGRRARRTR